MFEVALQRKRIPKSIQSTFLLAPLRLKLKKIQGLFKNLHRNLRTFQGKMEFKDFSRTPPKIQGLFKTVRTLYMARQSEHCDWFFLGQDLVIWMGSRNALSRSMLWKPG